MRVVALAIVAVVACITKVDAQVADSARGPEVGTRVRVFAPDLRSDRYVGRIKSLDASVMVLDTGEVRNVLGMESGPVLVDQYRRVTIRLSTIEALEVSGGRTAKSAVVRGMVLGALAGGILFGLGSMPEVNPDANDFMRGVPLGLVVGALGGGVIGWGVGGERWLPAPIPR
ncbi:MAG TPA: hypothetical protein VFZ73_12305 [Gemmatimonadaceae bacterium]